LLSNGELAQFTTHVYDKDRIAVFPHFYQVGVPQNLRLKPPLPVPPCFAVGELLGKLIRFLRILGIDTIEDKRQKDFDKERIIISRNRQRLKEKRVVFGYWPRSEKAEIQLAEVVNNLT